MSGKCGNEGGNIKTVAFCSLINKERVGPKFKIKKKAKRIPFGVTKRERERERGNLGMWNLTRCTLLRSTRVKLWGSL